MTNFELRAYRDDRIGHIHAEDVYSDDTLSQACKLADRFGLGYFISESGSIFNFSDGMVVVSPVY